MILGKKNRFPRTVMLNIDCFEKQVLFIFSYLKNAKRASALFRDQPETPLQRAVFYMEYLVRHKGKKLYAENDIKIKFKVVFIMQLFMLNQILIKRFLLSF